MSKWDSVDNSETIKKAAMRKYLIPDKTNILDLFCGDGKMYKLSYKNNTKVNNYTGVDKNKIHNEKLCYLQNNMKFIHENDISQYNVFDLDAYGCPWKLLFHILMQLNREKVIVFITDGLTTKFKMSGYVPDFVAATEKIPKNFKIYGIYRFYIDIFKTMLLRLKEKSGYKAINAKYFRNKKGTAYYWYLKFKNPEIPTKEK